MEIRSYELFEAGLRALVNEDQINSNSADISFTRAWRVKLISFIVGIFLLSFAVARRARPRELFGFHGASVILNPGQCRYYQRPIRSFATRERQRERDHRSSLLLSAITQIVSNKLQWINEPEILWLRASKSCSTRSGKLAEYYLIILL